MIFYNGTRCDTIEELEALIADLPEDQKEILRNDFNEVPNPVEVRLSPISPRQLRLKLFEMGIDEAAMNALIDQLEEPIRSIAHIEFDYAVEFDRYHPRIILIATNMGLTLPEMDTLWAEAILL